jgi:hypothetical protein
VSAAPHGMLRGPDAQVCSLTDMTDRGGSVSAHRAGRGR